VSLHVYSKWIAEIEIHRYLVEEGVVGFLLVWTVRFGLMIALIRASSILKKAGRRAVAGAALSYAAVTFFGHLTFDHIWQALYFVGTGFILAETKGALEILRERADAKAAAASVGPPPVSARA
jgi:Kef-type K+ transport system membrane component KefB